MLHPSISREELSSLPVRRYEGRILLVESLDRLDEARSDICRERVIGLDTETRPAFRKGESHLPCLVQVATAHAVYLFPLRYDSSFSVLADLLEAPAAVKAGVALAFDLRRLNLVFPFVEKNVVELSTIARRAGLEQAGVRNLAGIVLGYRIPKGNRTSNWAARRLSEAQIVYAATDAWICRELYLRFESLGLITRGLPSAA